MRALLSLPRDRAIDGLRAFNEMRYVCIHRFKTFSPYTAVYPNCSIIHTSNLSKLPVHIRPLISFSLLNRDDLLSYLRPFAQEGKVVNEADVRAFFERKQEARRAQAEVRYV